MTTEIPDFREPRADGRAHVAAMISAGLDARRWTGYELEAKTGLSRVRVYELMRGRPAKLETVLRYADALDLDPYLIACAWAADNLHALRTHP